MLSQKKLLENKGFTLLETIIALAIMVLAFASILTVESNSIRASIKAKQLNVVAMLARNTIEELELKLEGKKFDEVFKENSGQFDPPYESYRWKSIIKEIEFPNLAMASAQSKKEGDSSETDSSEMMASLTRILTKYLSQSIREVTVTIFWKKGSGEQNLSLSTYWVDLNHELDFSE